MPKERIKLGDTVREKLTGIEGRCIGYTTWETGCSHVGVKRLGLDKDNKPYEILWFDEPNCDVMGFDPAHAPRTDSPKPGGPIPNGR